VLGSKVVEQAVERTDGPIFAFTHGVTPSPPLAKSARVTWEPLDLAEAAAISAAIARGHPDIVINCAAMTNVDACEHRQPEAVAANSLGPRLLAEECARRNIRLVHVSTDYVFPGDKEAPGPYLEDAPVRPVNYYGLTKLDGERAIQEICGTRSSWLIARTAVVYGYIPGGRTNFVQWIYGALKSGKSVPVVDDQINTPTFADDLAAVLLHMAETGGEGIAHIAGPDLISRYEWAKIIASTFDLDESLIEVTSTAELNQPARRPLWSGLRTRRAHEWQGMALRGVREGLSALGLG
jgi:dTDP-4-dehydrorhamnose reductase